MLAMTGCKSGVKPQNTNTVQPAASGASSPAVGQGSAKAAVSNPAVEWVPVKANCIVYHSGYEGTIVARDVSEPTGTVARFTCNGKSVEIASKKMVKGIILTKDYGKVRVHFASMIATVGAHDFTDVGEGHTLPERVIDMSVQYSAVDRFMAQFR
jgi:hypothetical protein